MERLSKEIEDKRHGDQAKGQVCFLVKFSFLFEIQEPLMLESHQNIFEYLFDICFQNYPMSACLYDQL